MSSETIRILVVDDDPGDFEMTRAMLDVAPGPATDFEVEWAASWDEGLEALARRAHDVYLVDYVLEDRDGLALVREARKLGIRKPLIMLTGRGSLDVDVEAMEAGASDYLVKGSIDPDLLERTIRYALERFRSGEALRQSEERHRSMFDHLPIGLYRCSPDGRFMDANPALVRLLGRPDPDTLQKRWATGFYVAPGDVETFRASLEADGVVRAFATTLERGDGTPVRIVNTARVHRGADGSVEYVEGAVEDVTELESAQRLRGRAERFDVVYEHSRLAILLLDAGGRILGANPAFRRLFDYQEDDLEGRPLQELAAPTDRSLLEEDVATLTSSEPRRIEGERRLLAGDGTILWARIVASPVADADGRSGRIMVLMDEVEEAGGDG
ncbi:MAG TPA: PAS domain S-box protein [Longimicrobiales bacterium]|nr:PAS domain S-box protein [Longimicrobiales bacterium]